MIDSFRNNLNKDSYTSINLYFQDESRFGLMTQLGRKITAKGVKPIARYKHAFKNTYLYGSFSPLTGDSFVYEIEGTTSEIFYEYISELSAYKPREYKILLIDNAGFHSLKGRELPENIGLLRIPPYSPELNPAERVWGYIKSHFKGVFFEKLEDVKQWLHHFILNELPAHRVKSLTAYEQYTNCFMAHGYS